MSTERHPITPSRELAQQWTDQIYGGPGALVGSDDLCLAKLAAQWSADQELEACIDWISVYTGLEHPELLIELIRAARRPKPPSLKEDALAALHGIHDQGPTPEQVVTIRRALEQLDD